MSAALLCAVIVVCFGIGPIVDKRLLGHLSPDQLFVARFYVLFILMLTPMALGFDGVRLAVLRSESRIVPWIFFSAGLPLIGLWLYFRVLGMAEASRVVPIVASYPLVTALLAILVLREPVTGTKLAGVGMVVGGTYLLAAR